MRNLTLYFTKKIFGGFYSFNSKLFLMVAVFSFYSTFNLRILDQTECSVFEYALYAMSDHYYIVFFFFIMYSVIIFDLIKDSNSFILLRANRYYSYFVSKLTANAAFTISIVFLHALLAIIIGSFKHGWNNSFSIELNSITALSQIGMIFKEAFNSPLAALISVCLYLSLGLCVFSGFLILISHFFTEKAVIITEICVYLLIIISLQLNIDRTVPYFFIINYFLLHRALGYHIPIVLTAISVMMVVFMLIIANQQRYRILNHTFKTLLSIKVFGEVFTLKKMIAFVLTALILSALNIIKYNTTVGSGLDYTAMIFMGYGIGYINIIDFLHLIILNGIPIYILSVYFGNKDSMRSIVIVRYRHRSRWFLNIQLAMLGLILFEFILVSLITFLMSSAGIAFGILDSYNAGNLVNSAGIFWAGFVLRIFEIMFLQMVFLLLYAFMKSVIASFLTTISLYLFVLFFDGKFIPFGLSSLCRVLELSGNSLFYKSIVPAVIFSICYFVMYVYMIKSKAVCTLVSERSYI